MPKSDPFDKLMLIDQLQNVTNYGTTNGGKRFSVWPMVDIRKGAG